MEKRKTGNGILVGIWILVGFALLLVTVIQGAGKVTAWAIPAIATINGVVFSIALIVFLPMALLRRTRMHGAVALAVTSFIFGLTTWCVGLLTTFSLWGLVAVLIGILLGGFGVIPAGILAALLNSEWNLLANLTLGLVAACATRMLSLYFASKADQLGARETLVPEAEIL